MALALEVGEDHPDLSEYKALTSVLSSFYNFPQWQYDQLIKPRKLKIAILSDEELEYLPWLEEHNKHIEECITFNSIFTRCICSKVATDWSVTSNPAEWYEADLNAFDKVRSTLLQLTREWSIEGKHEREISFGRILTELTRRYPNFEDRKDVKILVPGCGLGRLVFEIVREGFWCQGNELNYHMLLASNFILNYCQYANEYSIFPFLHKSSNLSKRSNQIRPVFIPDECPTEIYNSYEGESPVAYEDLMSMAAGSFVELYGPPGTTSRPLVAADSQAELFSLQNKDSFDVVCTCFFLDTASNIIDYLKSIKHSLKPGAIWINFGPLLWHFENDASVYAIRKKLERDGDLQVVSEPMNGLELSREDLIELIKKMGFEFEFHETGIESSYSSDPRSLGSYVFSCDYWVCRKM